MDLFREFREESLRQAVGHQSCVMLDGDNGCTGECMAGISLYQTESYPEPQTHPFQEGFYVIEGNGFAKVDGEEFAISRGMAFLVPAGKPHSVRNGGEGPHVKVFWFHSA